MKMYNHFETSQRLHLTLWCSSVIFDQDSLFFVVVDVFSFFTSYVTKLVKGLDS